MNVLPLGSGFLQYEELQEHQEVQKAWLTLFSQRVTGWHAISVGDHTGESAKILHRGVVEDGPGPTCPHVTFRPHGHIY